MPTASSSGCVALSAPEVSDPGFLAGLPGSGRLTGKRVVVIGGGQTPGQSVGIGRAAALVFAREGATILLVDRDEVSVTETRRMILDAGGTASVHLADITREDECRGIAAAAVRALGGVDVLYNSVGILGPGTPAELSEELWDRVMDVNLKAMWLVDKHILPIMQKQRAGSVIHISSIAAERDGGLAGGLATAYAISKAGVNRLTVAVASASAGFNVRANAIEPGLVDTPMAIDATLESRGVSRENVIAERQSTVPMSFLGTAFDIAYAALFFASDESRYVSGQVIAVDGARGTS